MGVHCEIFIRRPNEGVHKSGLPVHGVVKYAVDKPTKCNDIVLSLLGRGYVTWSESDSDNETTYRGTEEYVSQHKNILVKKNDDEITIPVGSYEYPFEFILPEDIPSSHKGVKSIVTSEIKYYLKLKFTKPGLFSINKKFKKELIVYGNVNTLHPNIKTPLIFGLEKQVMSLFSAEEQKINVKCEIYKTLFAPGETTTLNVTVYNNSNVKVTAIRTEIVSETKFTANCGKNHQSQYTIKESISETEGVNENSQSSLSVIVTALPELYSIQHSRIIDRKYLLRVTSRLPIPHVNASVDLPIVIGETMDNVEIAVEADEATTYHEPPSYWETMNEYESENKM